MGYTEEQKEILDDAKEYTKKMQDPEYKAHANEKFLKLNYDF